LRERTPVHKLAAPTRVGTTNTVVTGLESSVRSRWNDADADAFGGPLGARVYTSRLLGAEPALVMHGGGNTSVKATGTDVFGDQFDLLYVKGSGSDLASMTAAGFAPLLLDRTVRLANLEALTDAEMTEQLRLACTSADAPAPSVEAILHAILPDTYVDHTHADAVLSLTNTPNGRKWIDEVYGEQVVVVDYVMPGFALARRCALEIPARRTQATVGVILMQHGIFTFGETARESYERMIALVTTAEEFLAQHDAWELPERVHPRRVDRGAVADLRSSISRAAGAPMILTTTRSPRVDAFLDRDDHADLAGRGPLTPDHVIRTKRVPLIGRDVDEYVVDYREYFDRNDARTSRPLTMLDPAPRVVLDAELGLLTAGRTARDAAVARDIALHTIDAIERSARLDDWHALPETDIFDVEYWELEQAKLARQGAPAPLAGEVALVTGAASGIGRATAAQLQARGAAVVALDLDPRITEGDDPSVLGLECDVTDEHAIDRALDAAVERFGGLDIVVLNAGIFPPSTPIDSLSLADWRRVMAVNVDANLAILSRGIDLLARAPRRGRVVVNASKNVPAPGPGAAAYSASKASLTQLARVAALEWSKLGVRVNIVHPNAVFDTGIWTDDVLAARAASYGLSVEEYRRNNLLGVEVTSNDVAGVIVALCSDTFSRTTGAQIPVDGGNERVL
jgi:rhamnose utilization protein RhaD (predicted bifunctional aldolase and dehydrogenase)/NAD(P)-dependent dehydrogenase (short-subunit alcohol dehydrogenase family)